MPPDSEWRNARRLALRSGAERHPDRECRRREALELLRRGPLVVWPHRCAPAVGRVVLRDLLREGLITVTTEDHLDLVAFARGEYTLRRCKVYRLAHKPALDE